MTIGVPIVTGLPRLYQQCTNRQKQSNSENDHWCTNRHMSTQSLPNTHSPRPRLPNTQSLKFDVDRLVSEILAISEVGLWVVHSGPRQF